MNAPKADSRCTPQRRPVQCDGLTLVELLVTLAILVIMVTLAVGSYQGIIASNSLDTAASNLRSQMASARSEALAQGTTVTIAPMTSSGSGSLLAWSRDYRVWVNPLNSTTFNPSEALGTSGTDKKQATLLQEGLFVDNNLVNIYSTHNNISFRSDGRSMVANGSGSLTPVAASFTLCVAPNVLNENARQINISIAGRVTISKKSVPTC